MATKPRAREKGNAIGCLSFDVRTAKRATFEAFEFTVVGSSQVEVKNASYGTEKDDHAYRVEVEERDGLAVPTECECPADVHRGPDCKHKVALASVGGKTVLNAAVAFEESEPASSDRTPVTSAVNLPADGGSEALDSGEEDTCPNGDPRCEGPGGDELPCFPCYYREGE